MKMTRGLYVAVVLGAVAGSAAGDVFWDEPDGSGNFFSWNDGRSINGLFGSPQLIGGNTFLFNPAQFRASATDGATDNVADTLIFDLHADAGFRITGLQIVQAGSYTLTGDSSAEISGNLLVDDIGGQNVRSEGGPIDYIPGSPFIGPDNGTFDGQVIADLSAGDPWMDIHIELSTDLIAISTAGTSSTISLDAIGSQIAINIVPAPASALGLVGLLAFARRRR